ncbi:MAG: hypothetical protein ACM3IJ_04555 [Candidatus Levyibacteriota bacterium]
MSILKSVLFFILFLAVAAGAFYGVAEPQNTLISSVGPMQLTAGGAGLSLFQGSTGQYYDFSPFKDTVTFQNTTTNALVTAQDIQSTGYKTSLKVPFIQNLWETFLFYTGADTPSMRFLTGKNITYSSTIKANKLIVTRTIQGEKNPITKTDMTITFHAMDFVFDRTGNLYNYVDPGTQSFFEQTYNKTLTPQLNDTSITVMGNIVFIYNPKIAAVMAIQTVGNQTITVDRNEKVIRISETPKVKNNIYQDSLQVTVLNTPKEAFNL